MAQTTDVSNQYLLIASGSGSAAVFLGSPQSFMGYMGQIVKRKAGLAKIIRNAPRQDDYQGWWDTLGEQEVTLVDKHFERLPEVLYHIYDVREPSNWKLYNCNCSKLFGGDGHDKHQCGFGVSGCKSVEEAFNYHLESSTPGNKASQPLLVDGSTKT